MGWGRTSAPVIIVMVLGPACSGGYSPTAPTQQGSSTPVPTTHTGPIAIAFVDASPPPGATITGCGTSVGGCARRLTMRFSLRAQEPGPVSGVRAFLHGTNNLACLLASVDSFDLARGEVREVAVTFDRSDDRCPIPLDIANMALVVEGPAQVASRQEWAIRYTFVP